MTENYQQLGMEAKAWPFREAQKLLTKRLRDGLPEKGYVLFETGYGPSGLPHIGTFAEVVRTTMVRNAFNLLAPEMPTRLFCFSDDMDGLRKVPDNIPSQDQTAKYLGKPLTSVPDPFGTYNSFGEHNNARLQQFLDDFGFEYEFLSSTECYREGRFDQTLLAVLAYYDEIVATILPTLGAERQATYSPFLPISPSTGRVLQVPVLERDVEAGTIVFEDEDGQLVETTVTGGACKLQWKCDWAMRWTALEVDYEMSGKDLLESVHLSSRICRILGGQPPNNLIYEMFLDEKGEKISKSKGNGLAVEDWLRYAPQESLSYFMFQKPQTAKRLYFDVIPKSVDDYLMDLERYVEADSKTRLNTPSWHIHQGQPPKPEAGISYSILLNLVSAAHSDDPDVLWHYVSRYAPEATRQNSPTLDELIRFAIQYYRDFVLPTVQHRPATDAEKVALEDLHNALADLTAVADAAEIQNRVYEVGKQHDSFGGLRNWFKALYQILLGQDSGPRMGSFIALYGVEETQTLLRRAIAGEDLSA